MLSIISGLLGIGSSALPSLLGFFQQKGDQKHEMAMARLQTEREAAMAAAGFASQEKIEAIKLEEVEMQTYKRLIDQLIEIYSTKRQLAKLPADKTKYETEEKKWDALYAKLSEK